MIREISGSKGGKKKQRAPVEAPNTLRSAATARIIDLIGEGPIHGLVNGLKSVYLDDTPLQNDDDTYNFQGVVVHTRTGEPNQSRIPGFADVESEVDVSTQVKTTQPVVRQVTNLEVDAVRIKIRVPALTKTNTGTGDIKGTSVTLEVDVMPSGGVWTKVSTITISGKTTSPYERQTRVDLPGNGPWNIRVRRVTADSTKSALQNDTYWASYTEITDVRLTYPDSALVGIQIDARQFGNNVPSRSYDVKGRIIKVPSNYNPETRTYTGLWNGSFKPAWTDNPAWIFYDMATNPRFGAKLENVDKWALYQIGQYCDELVPDGYGGMEPRFTVNTVLAEQVDAIVALGQMASAFRGMTYWGTNTAMPVADMPADPVKLVTPANVIGGEFEYSGTALRDRHSVAAITWNDPEDNYRKQVEIVEDADAIRQFGWRQTDVTAFGCTSRGQARRLGLWLLYSERAETETVTYRAGTDHLDARPGDIIAISDPSTAGARMGGRIKATGSKTLTLDAVPSNVSGSTWYLDAVLPTGTIERRQVASFSGNTVTLSTAFSATPIQGAMWVLSSLSLQPRLFRIASVSELDDATYQITAAEHDPLKYDKVEQELTDFGPPATKVSSIPAQVVGLTATDTTYKAGSGISTKMVVSWERSDDSAISWRVRIRNSEDGNWETFDNLPTPVLDVPNVADGDTYVIECYGINSVGDVSPTAAVYVHTVIGKIRPPADVTGFVSVPDGSSMKFMWDNVPDVDLKEYEVRFDDAGWGDNDPTKIAYRGPNNSFTAPAGSAAAQDTTLFIKAVDTSGNYSEQPAQLNVVYVKPSTPVLTRTYYDTSSVAAKVLIEWQPSTSNFPVYRYEVTVSKPGKTPVTTIQAGTSYELPLDFLGNATVSVVAVDTMSKRSNSGTTTVESLVPTAPTTSKFTSIGVGLLRLDWGPGGRTSLPIAGYEVRTSNSGWGSDGAVHRGEAPMCQINEIVKGDNVFYIKAFDTEGRYSSTALSATFNYAGPSLTGLVAADFATVSQGSGLLEISWPQSSSPFGLEKYAATLTLPGGRVIAQDTLANRWEVSVDWVGTATFRVSAYDKAGNQSDILSKTLTRLAPNAVSSVDIKLVSYANQKMTVALDWPEEGVKSTLPIAGYEMRKVDAGWGTPGFVYKGQASTTTVAGLSTTVDTIYYLRAFDINGAYSATSLQVNVLKNVGPEPVTGLAAAPKGEYLRITWKAAVSTGGDVKYEIRSMDKNWGLDDDDRLYYGANKFFDVKLGDVGEYKFYIRALDKFWEYSLTSEVAYTYGLDAVTEVTHQFGPGATVTLKWPAAKPSFGLADYVISDGVETLYSKTNSVNVPVTWKGARTFTVKVRDSNLNVSAAVDHIVSVVGPVMSTVLPTFKLGATAKDGTSTVTLDWKDATPTALPIKGYEIRDVDAGWGTGDAIYYGTGSKATITGVRQDVATTWYLRCYDVANNYSETSLVLTNDGIGAPPAVTGVTYEPEGSGIRITWDQSPEVDVVEYEIRTSDSGWGGSGQVYRGAETTFLLSKPPVAGATYYIKARDAYKKRSPATSFVFTYPQPQPVSAVTAQFSPGSGNVLIDWPDTNPPLTLKHYEVTYTSGSSTKTTTTKASTLTIATPWVGDESVSVRVVDAHGAKSVPTTYSVPVDRPGQVPVPTLTVESIKSGKQTIKLDWAESAAGSFRVAGYEIRTTDSGWGTSGHKYKGASSQALLSNVSTTAASTWYIKAYDARGNYSELARRVDYVTVLPDEVTSVSVKRKLATLHLDAVTRNEPADFLCVEYRVGKVVAGATTGDDPTGITEGVVGTATSIWDDPDVQKVRGTETSNKATLDLNKFGKPLFHKQGIKYLVEARIVDKGGNFSPNSAKTSLTVKTLS